MQSRSQARELHARTDTKFPHDTPPPLGWTVTLRMRSWKPPSHLAEQLDHPLHALVSQSSGHSSSEQGCVILRGGQAAPPSDARISTSLALLRAPPPQEVLQTPSLHSVTSQSCGNSFFPAASDIWSRTCCRLQSLCSSASTSSRHVFSTESTLLFMFALMSSFNRVRSVIPPSRDVASDIFLATSFLWYDVSVICLCSKVRSSLQAWRLAFRSASSLALLSLSSPSSSSTESMERAQISADGHCCRLESSACCRGPLGAPPFETARPPVEAPRAASRRRTAMRCEGASCARLVSQYPATEARICATCFSSFSNASAWAV
mmetsp:Transcript_12482/g.44134  ORF Transcript_12482/g.44134 Transcript_12482/m.44134 type:complete len:320 (+) Transcript_12482:876-1835(+)